MTERPVNIRAGFWKYVPGERPPIEATSLLEHSLAWHLAGGPLNQAPMFQSDFSDTIPVNSRPIAGLLPLHREPFTV